MESITAQVSNKLDMTNTANEISNAISLLIEKKYSIPYVAQFQKEQTGSMNEASLRKLKDTYLHFSELENHKKRYYKIAEDFLNARPELSVDRKSLKEQFFSCQSKYDLEDLYLPFKPRRGTSLTKNNYEQYSTTFVKLILD